MAYPFGKSPKLKEYLVSARKLGCEVIENCYDKKFITRITSLDNKIFHFVNLSDKETLSHSIVAQADKRLGIDSPFPKTPTPPKK